MSALNNNDALLEMEVIAVLCVLIRRDIIYIYLFLFRN